MKTTTKKSFDLTSALSDLFTTLEIESATIKDEKIVYNTTYMYAEQGTPERTLYEIVSDVAYNSGISHGFSYEIVSRACDVLAENGLDCDDYAQAIDAIVPVYNSEIMQIMASDYAFVDDAVQEYGIEECDTIKNAMLAWYMLIDNTVHELRAKLMSEYE